MQTAQKIQLRRSSQSYFEEGVELFRVVDRIRFRTSPESLLRVGPEHLTPDDKLMLLRMAADIIEGLATQAFDLGLHKWQQLSLSPTSDQGTTTVVLPVGEPSAT